MEKIKILVIPSDVRGGVGFYRSLQPHRKLTEMFPDRFEVTMGDKLKLTSSGDLMKYDIVNIHKGLFSNMDKFREMLKETKESSTVTVMDIDDSWDLSPTHPLYKSQKINHTDDIIKQNLTEFEHVTTTTPIFADEIRPFNPNVTVLPNAIDPNAPEFTINKKKSDKIRFGFVMGSAHEEDVRLMGNFVSKLKPETLEKIQIVLCGFDIRGYKRNIDPNTKKVTETPMQPNETTWYRYEHMVTDNRRIISDRYKKFLNMYVPGLEYPYYESEHYHRCWTKDLDHYYSHYENIDVLYAPLEPKHFNYVKSQLKAIECCFSDTALIAQNYGPYTIDLVHGRNALLVDTDKNDTDWVRFTEELVADPSKIKMLSENLHEDLKDKYNLETVTRQRADFYERIIKEKRG